VKKFSPDLLCNIKFICFFSKCSSQDSNKFLTASQVLIPIAEKAELSSENEPGEEEAFQNDPTSI
jgi:hypothetical protein